MMEAISAVLSSGLRDGVEVLTLHRRELRFEVPDGSRGEIDLWVRGKYRWVEMRVGTGEALVALGSAEVEAGEMERARSRTGRRMW
jgi:hypothetical protein